MSGLPALDGFWEPSSRCSEGLTWPLPSESAAWLDLPLERGVGQVGSCLQLRVIRAPPAGGQEENHMPGKALRLAERSLRK